MTSAYHKTAGGLFVPAPSGIECSICGEEIPKAAFGSHAELCYRENEEQIQAEAERQKTPIFEHDTELQAYMKQKGQRK